MFAANIDPVSSDEVPNPLTHALAEAKLAAEAEARLVSALQVKSKLAKVRQAPKPEPEPQPEPEPELQSVDSPLVSTDLSFCSPPCNQSLPVVSASLSVCILVMKHGIRAGQAAEED